jgi:hypothetical protein
LALRVNANTVPAIPISAIATPTLDHPAPDQ